MLDVNKTGFRFSGKSLCYLHKFSVNLKLFYSKSIFNCVIALQKTPFTNPTNRYVLGGSHAHTQCLGAGERLMNKIKPSLPSKSLSIIGGQEMEGKQLKYKYI